MGPHALDTSKKIPPTQAVWQVFEVIMNACILWTMLTIGFSPPLILWTVFEVLMNAWILVTMIKVGFKRKPLLERG